MLYFREEDGNIISNYHLLLPFGVTPPSYNIGRNLCQYFRYWLCISICQFKLVVNFTEFVSYLLTSSVFCYLKGVS